jgi:hypothetical protein
MLVSPGRHFISSGMGAILSSFAQGRNAKIELIMPGGACCIQIVFAHFGR